MTEEKERERMIALCELYDEACLPNDLWGMTCMERPDNLPTSIYRLLMIVGEYLFPEVTLDDEEYEYDSENEANFILENILDSVLTEDSTDWEAQKLDKNGHVSGLSVQELISSIKPGDIISIKSSGGATIPFEIESEDDANKLITVLLEALDKFELKHYSNI